MELFWISLLAGGITTAFMALVALVAARVRLSMSRRPGFVLDLLFLLPLLIPSTLVSYGLAALQCGRTPNIWFVVGYMAVVPWIVAAPFVYFGAVICFRKTSPELIDAARLQGLGALSIFWRIRIRMGWPWLIAGLLLGFIRALGETSARFLPYP